MSRNGSGVYTPPLNSWNPPVNGDQALPADWKAILDDVTNALTGSLAADGQTPITGILNFQNNRISNVGAPVGAGDALRFQQMQKGANIASAATITIPIEGNLFEVMGTTGITAINDTFPGRLVWLYFQNALTLTNSANFVLPAGQDIKTAAGDALCAINTGAGIWTVVSWAARKDGDANQNFKAAPSTHGNEVTVQSQVFGIGQTWQDVTAFRAATTNFTNTTGKPILVRVSLGGIGSPSYAVLNVALAAPNPGAVIIVAPPGGTTANGYLVVPAGDSYSLTVSGTTGITLTRWWEYR